ncbi:Protein kinase domain [Dillenia turbinata]|uniref:Protein kinase domain n=1 Tax=Dillenia turbinata TaxID=194707 RepID=A0AAN8VFP8_9MAGN
MPTMAHWRIGFTAALAMKSQFVASGCCFLAWNQRQQICLDVAVALHHMHYTMNPYHVQRNILLHEEFEEKDWKCAKGSSDSSRRHSANPASWSKEYLAPEYLEQGNLSPSTDIFAYGVVLLEILHAKMPITRSEEKGKGNVWLCEKIKSMLHSEDAEEPRQWTYASVRRRSLI